MSPQPGLISPYPIPGQVALILLALGGVWGAYVYVVRLLIGIREDRVYVDAKETKGR